jgi:predicted metalloprotease with PDZ domain
VYWGGTLFWLVADVRLRRATNDARSIRDAVVHIANEGGNGRASWTTARVIEQADRATGTTVVSELYRQMARAPGDVDLPALMASLGVVGEGDDVSFDDTAPEAAIRRAITAR